MGGVALAPSAGPTAERGPRERLAVVPPALAQQALSARGEHVAFSRASRSEGPVSLAWPAEGPLTSVWGEGRNHPGVDLDGETGDPITAAGPGVVTVAGPPPAGYGGYGLIVIIDHGQGVSTLYAHLSSVAVTAGQTVAPGDLVGAVGTTGIVTGSHIHFEVRVNGLPVDPETRMPPRERRLL